MLLDALAQRDADAPLWLTTDACWNTAQAGASILRLRAAWQALAGARVAVHLHEPIDFVQAIAALDGLVEGLLLIPAQTAPQQVADFVRRAGATALVADADPGLPGCSWLAGPATARAAAAAMPAPPLPTRWLLTTSGTTGTPKLVPHTLDTLCATAQRDTARGRDLHWGLLYDPARFAGLQVVLQALLGGSALSVPTATMDFNAQLAHFGRCGVNALSATPTLWRKLLIAGAALPLQTLTLGGEVADARILQALALRFPAARLRHVYASTEAGVGFSVSDGREGFPAAWLAAPPAGVELRIDPTPADEGELWIRSTRAASGYHGGQPLQDAAGWLATGDRVRNDGLRVRFLGRINGAINIGGDKVYPEAVERVLLDHPSVFGARVRAKASAITGALVEALVLPAQGIVADTALRQALLGHCRQTLPRHAVPALLRFVTQLDTNASGKQERCS